MTLHPGLKAIKFEFILKLIIKCNDLMLADTSANSQSLPFISSFRMNSSFIASRPGYVLCVLHYKRNVTVRRCIYLPICIINMQTVLFIVGRVKYVRYVFVVFSFSFQILHSPR